MLMVYIEGIYYMSNGLTFKLYIYNISFGNVLEGLLQLEISKNRLGIDLGISEKLGLSYNPPTL